MPIPTYTAIATATLTANANSLTFLNITQQYRDIILVTNMLSNIVNEGYIEFNASSSNFTMLRMYGLSSSVASNTYTTNNPIATTTGGSHHIVQIVDYSATDKHKNFLVRTARTPDNFVSAWAGRWASTSQITSITLRPNPGAGAQFISGFTASLYGILG